MGCLITMIGKVIYKSVLYIISYHIAESQQRMLATGQKYEAGYLTSATDLQLSLDARTIQESP